MIHGLLHELMRLWFGWVEQWGYWGVGILMAMESSIFPVPSEIVMPPAAYWASQGKMTFWGVVLAGTVGSYLGSAITYWASQKLGLPFIKRYGKYVFLNPDKLAGAERWVAENGEVGVFVARLLPVVRHLISIPAGVFQMNFLRFSVVTVTGAALWCTVLSWFGMKVLGEAPELLQSPEELSRVVKAKLIWFVAGVVVLGVLYVGVKAKLKKPASGATS